MPNINNEEEEDAYPLMQLADQYSRDGSITGSKVGVLVGLEKTRKSTVTTTVSVLLTLRVNQLTIKIHFA